MSYNLLLWVWTSPGLAGRSLTSWLLFPFDTASLLEPFTALRHRKRSRLILFVPSLPQRCSQPCFQGSLVPVREEWYLKTKISVLDVLLVIGAWLPPGPFQGPELGNICRYHTKVHTVSTPIFIFIVLYFYMSETIHLYQSFQFQYNPQNLF